MLDEKIVRSLTMDMPGYSAKGKLWEGTDRHGNKTKRIYFNCFNWSSGPFHGPQGEEYTMGEKKISFLTAEDMKKGMKCYIDVESEKIVSGVRGHRLYEAEDIVKMLLAEAGYEKAPKTSKFTGDASELLEKAKKESEETLQMMIEETKHWDRSEESTNDELKWAKREIPEAYIRYYFGYRDPQKLIKKQMRK